MNIVEAKGISHSYIVSNRKIHSLKEVTYDIKKGDFVAIIGRNGCGKSTLAKHINVLLPLQKGSLVVAGFDAGNKANTQKIRRHCAMVFQNPDNQFVSQIVSEDIRFGLKNFGLNTDDSAVSSALESVGMAGFENRNINTLSGGQKQKIALAGVLAVKPDIIILDEATTMLPPEGRQEILDLILKLHRDTDITFIMITQYVDEAVCADKVMVMNNGKITAYDDTPKIMPDTELLHSSGLTPPFAVSVYNKLKAKGIVLGNCPLTKEGLVNELCRL